MPVYYDPLVLAERLEPLVAPRRGGVQYRRYYRFRPDRWYGGIATGDVVGCILRCGFCWAFRVSWTSGGGMLLSPREAGERLVRIARRRGFRQVRLSGGEPTIGFSHLIDVIDYVTGHGLHFVVETNGILIGCREGYAEKLAQFHGRGIEVRVSIKGTSPEEFAMLTGASPDAWRCQIRALRLLVEHGLEPGEEVYPAIMLSFSSEEGFKRIKRVLSSIHPALAREIDPEYVILYPHVERLLRTRRLSPRKAFRPGEIPEWMI